MNISKVLQDHVSTLVDTEEVKKEDQVIILRARLVRLEKLILAHRTLLNSEAWTLIRDDIDDRLENLNNTLHQQRDTIDIYRTQGAIGELKKLDLERSLQGYLKELARIQEQIKQYE